MRENVPRSETVKFGDQDVVMQATKSENAECDPIFAQIKALQGYAENQRELERLWGRALNECRLYRSTDLAI